MSKAEKPTGTAAAAKPTKTALLASGAKNVAARLAAMSLKDDAGAQFKAILLNPEAYATIYDRLAEFDWQDEDLRTRFIDLARSVADLGEEGDTGYPSDSASNESNEDTDEDVGNESSEDDPETDSEAHNNLSDEEVELVLIDNEDREARQAARQAVRFEEAIPAWVEEGLVALRKEKDDWWSDDDLGEEGTLAVEVESELEEEEYCHWTRGALEEEYGYLGEDPPSQPELAPTAVVATPTVGAAAVVAVSTDDYDPLSLLLCDDESPEPEVVKPKSEKRKRVDTEEASRQEIEDEFDLVDAELTAAEEGEAQKEEALADLCDALGNYRILANLGSDDDDDDDDHFPQPLRAAAKMARDHCDCDDIEQVELADIAQQVALVKVELDLLVKDRPDLCQRRVELEELHQIRVEQRKTDLVIDPTAFSRLVNELLLDIGHRPRDTAISAKGVEALQTAAEEYLTSLFEDTNRVAVHDHRTMISVRDMRLLGDLRGYHK